MLHQLWLSSKLMILIVWSGPWLCRWRWRCSWCGRGWRRWRACRWQPPEAAQTIRRMAQFPLLESAKNKNLATEICRWVKHKWNGNFYFNLPLLILLSSEFQPFGFWHPWRIRKFGGTHTRLRHLFNHNIKSVNYVFGFPPPPTPFRDTTAQEYEEHLLAEDSNDKSHKMRFYMLTIFLSN